MHFINFNEDTMANKLHEEVFEFLEKYRMDHPGFFYSLRGQNRYGRLENGFWFQGTETYAFVGLYKKGCSANKTNTVGLVFVRDEEGRIVCWMENVFVGETDPETLDFYSEMRALIGGFEEKLDQRYHKSFPGADGFAAATTFLEQTKPEIDRLIEKHHLTSFFITRGEFQKKLNRISIFRSVVEENVSLSDVRCANNLDSIEDIYAPLNQILFGPPGTGKTYHTVNEALKIVDNDFYIKHKNNRKELTERFRELLIKDWEGDGGQIAFTTFHQSFCYEDFVEGIKPLRPKEEDSCLKYDIEEGVFKKLCRLSDDERKGGEVEAKKLVNLREEDFDNARFFKLSLGDSTNPDDDEIYEYCVGHSCIAIGFGGAADFSGLSEEKIRKKCYELLGRSYDATALNYFIHGLQVGDYVLIGNGNRYVRAMARVTGEHYYDAKVPIRYHNLRNVEWVFKGEDIPVTELYSRALSQTTIYRMNKDVLKKAFFVPMEGQRPPVRTLKNYVLIIDEINRGNVASIFGELITLIEDNKRAGAAEELEVTLPYSKERFKVPGNVYIIGTMNTADRGIEALDTALRRRFSFVEKPPRPELLEGELVEVPDGGNIDLCLLLKTMNARIERLIDKDHQIGHAYFIGVKALEDLEQVFLDKIIPLLEEYFYGDYGKIGLVLGDTFVEKISDKDVKFASFNGCDVNEAGDRPVFRIKKPVHWKFDCI